MSNERRRGDKRSYPICVWNGIFDHYQKIGIALWEFLWLIDAITLEQDGIGWVYSKRPFKLDRIVDDLGTTRGTVRRNLDRLRHAGYITTQKARYGIIVGVLNSRKIRSRNANPDGPETSTLESRPPKNGHSDGSKMDTLVAKSEHSGDFILNDNAVRQSNKTAAAASPVWKELGISPLVLKRVPAELRELCEGLLQTRSDQSVGAALGIALDLWTDQGKKIPPQLARAAAEVREREKAAKKAAVTVPELEDLAWRKK